MRAVIGIATALTIIGGLNWGLVGAFDFNLVEAILGEDTTATKVVYILVGISALLAIANFFRSAAPAADHHHRGDSRTI